MAEIEINGKKVVLRDKLPAKANYDMLGNAAQVIEGAFKDFDKGVAFIQRFVVSWEFDGDPADPASYEDLDLTSEMLALVGECGNALNRGTAKLKNFSAPPTSPESTE